MTQSTSTIPQRSGEQVLEHACGRWNVAQRLIWNIGASYDPTAWRQHKEVEARLFDGKNILSSPGPFKRMAAYGILSQYFPVITIQRESGEKATELDDDLLWTPRATLWGMMHCESLFQIGGQKFPACFGLPTPHFQLEFVAYLRNLRASVRERADKVDLAELTERVTLAGLAVEAATYASSVECDHIDEMKAHAKNCGPANEKEADDLRFNDGQFLEIAAGFGVD